VVVVMPAGLEGVSVKVKPSVVNRLVEPPSVIVGNVTVWLPPMTMTPPLDTTG
jgi:hypothetical protein